MFVGLMKCCAEVDCARATSIHMQSNLIGFTVHIDSGRSIHLLCYKQSCTKELSNVAGSVVNCDYFYLFLLL